MSEVCLVVFCLSHWSPFIMLSVVGHSIVVALTACIKWPELQWARAVMKES